MKKQSFILFLTIILSIYTGFNKVSQASAASQNLEKIEEKWQKSKKRYISGYFSDAKLQVAPEKEKQEYSAILFEINQALNNHLDEGSLSQEPETNCFFTNEPHGYYIDGTVIQFHQEDQILTIELAAQALPCQSGDMSVKTTYQENIAVSDDMTNYQPIIEYAISSLISNLKKQLVQ